MADHGVGGQGGHGPAGLTDSRPQSRGDEQRRRVQRRAAQHSPALLRRATLLCGDRHQPEDLVQETLVRLFLRWRRVDLDHNPLLRCLRHQRQLPEGLRRGRHPLDHGRPLDRQGGTGPVGLLQPPRRRPPLADAERLRRGERSRDPRGPAAEHEAGHRLADRPGLGPVLPRLSLRPQPGPGIGRGRSPGRPRSSAPAAGRRPPRRERTGR
ncbi:RNA polymerase sigma factor [uncultured Friedmanniella sp.]|uniref:RNA polymerase sigma factor n=1 Tax=uncultured Friedmanniella sp. TaxID=335381 RepID=UPI0035CC6EF2